MSLVDRWLSRPMSQRVAKELRREKPQESTGSLPKSQLSQMSQAAFAEAGAPVHNPSPTEPTVIAPVLWYERLVPPELRKIPNDQASPERCGWVQRVGPTFLHFCIGCGAWGSFGYGITRDRQGLWYCNKHRPDGGQHFGGSAGADEPR